MIYLNLGSKKTITYQCSRDRPKLSGVQIGDAEHGNLDYLQLRKDTLKIPKQFYLRKDLSEKLSNNYNSGVGEFLKYASTEGNKDKSNSD